MEVVLVIVGVVIVGGYVGDTLADYLGALSSRR